MLNPAGLGAVGVTVLLMAYPCGQGLAAEGVLDRVPASAVGFVVIRDAGSASARVDAFAKAISPAGEPVLPAPVLEIVKARFGIGEGFDPKQGFAAVMLDPGPYGLDLAAALVPLDEAEKSKYTADKVPLVLLIPGTDPAKLFALRKPTIVDGVVQFAGEDGKPRHCIQAGPYTALGANLQAVRAVAAEQAKTITGRLSAADKAFIGAHDLAVWADLKRLRPVLDAVWARRARRQQAQAGGQPPQPKLADALNLVKGNPWTRWRETLRQMDSAVAGLRFTDAGLFVDARGTFSSGSELGEVLAGYSPEEAKLLDRLPAMGYMLALGVLNAPKAPPALAAKQVDQALAASDLKRLPESAKATYRKCVLEMGNQIKAVQLCVGAGKDSRSGVRIVYVVRCDSAAKVRRLLGQLVSVTGQASGGASGSAVSLEHQPDAAKVAGRSADVIAVKVTPASPAQRKMVAAVLGGDQLRLTVVQADPHTLLIATDVDKALLDSVTASEAKGTGKLQADAAVAKALAMLPAKRTAVGVVNLRNLQPLIRAVRAAGGGKVVDINIDSDAPIAAAVSVQGRTVGVSVVVPTDTAREAVRVLSVLLTQGQD